MTLQEIKEASAAERRVHGLKANAKAAKERARQMKANADAAAEVQRRQQDRKQQRELRKASLLPKPKGLREREEDGK